MCLLYLNHIYQITYMDQINLGHENLIPVYMYPKIDEYFVNIETKSTDMICLNPEKRSSFLLDFSVVEMKHLCI